MIQIVPYDPRWPLEFTELAQGLWQALGDLAMRIDHIGSTSIPGLAAKDVIDIQVTVQAFTTQLETTLGTLGYTGSPTTIADHPPPLDTSPDEQWQKWYFRPPANQRKTHLHVRIQGHANQRYPLLFRDYLRAHTVAASTYGLIKEQLARYHSHDRDAYYDIKDPVCDLIWDAAQAWANATGWNPEAV